MPVNVEPKSVARGCTPALCVHAQLVLLGGAANAIFKKQRSPKSAAPEGSGRSSSKVRVALTTKCSTVEHDNKANRRAPQTVTIGGSTVALSAAARLGASGDSPNDNKLIRDLHPFGPATRLVPIFIGPGCSRLPSATFDVRVRNIAAGNKLKR
jgi:hypothetical protein